MPPCEKSENKKRFSYDRLEDGYRCPLGHPLKYAGLSTDKKTKVYRIIRKNLRLTCVRFGACTKSRHGKTVSRLIKEESRLRFEEEYQRPESQKIYQLRQQKAELPFGHIKRNLGVGAFLLKGIEGI